MAGSIYIEDSTVYQTIWELHSGRRPRLTVAFHLPKQYVRVLGVCMGTRRAWVQRLSHQNHSSQITAHKSLQFAVKYQL